MEHRVKYQNPNNQSQYYLIVWRIVDGNFEIWVEDSNETKVNEFQQVLPNIEVNPDDYIEKMKGLIRQNLF